MKKVMLGGVALITLGFVGAAVAADMPVKAPPPVVVNTWTGFYIGVDVGGVQWLRMTTVFHPEPGIRVAGCAAWCFDPVVFQLEQPLGRHRRRLCRLQLGR